MSGFGWAENFGWIHFRNTSPTAYGVAVACGTITGAVSGGGTICAGSSSSIAVTVSGGAPPYSVTLDYGGGTQSGAGPAFTFNLTPSNTTSYAVASLSDGLLCAGSGSGNATVTVNPQPATPSVTAPTTIAPGHSFAASVPAVAGVDYAWIVGGGSVTAGAGTNQVTVQADISGTVSISVTETDQTTACISDAGTASVTIAMPAGSTAFYHLTPCRVFDTRSQLPAVDAAWPVLAAKQARILQTAGRCGIPSTAVALSVNITAVDAVVKGNLVIYRGDQTAPTASLLNFPPTIAKANNTIVELAPDGSMGVLNRASGTVNFVMDVNGYFQ
jgi:hypothetical protein